MKSTIATPRNKPAKPYPDFPLTPHNSGRWCKKVRGKVLFFGPWADPDGALTKWLDEKDDLLAGRKPRVKSDGIQVYDLCNRFLTAKTAKLDAGRMSPRTFADYRSTTDRIIAAFGTTRVVVDLGADDFEALRNSLMKTLGPVREGNEIQRIRSVFKYAYENRLVPAPVTFGSEFKKPALDVLRRNRSAKGPKMIEAKELRKIIDAAGLPMKAMVLLALNAGFGNSDLSAMPTSAINLAKGWADYARVKTGIMRRAKLWPETTKAVKEWLAVRPKPNDDADAGLLFITSFGQRFVKINDKGHPADALGQEFAKLLKDKNLHKPGLGFYTLRHVFATIAGGTCDQVAVNYVMGHHDASMAATYRERIDDARLVKVADHVRRWLFPPKGKGKAK